MPGNMIFYRKTGTLIEYFKLEKIFHHSPFALDVIFFEFDQYNITDGVLFSKGYFEKMRADL